MPSRKAAAPIQPLPTEDESPPLETETPPARLVVDYVVTLSDEDAAKIDQWAANKGMTGEDFLAAAIKQLVVQERWPIRALI